MSELLLEMIKVYLEECYPDWHAEYRDLFDTIDITRNDSDNYFYIESDGNELIVSVRVFTRCEWTCITTDIHNILQAISGVIATITIQ